MKERQSDNQHAHLSAENPEHRLAQVTPEEQDKSDFDLALLLAQPTERNQD